jgi:hypothetical protein
MSVEPEIISEELKIADKVYETVKKLTKRPIEVSDFLVRFKTETGWSYSFDPAPIRLREKYIDMDGGIVRETLNCEDEVYVGEYAVVTIRAKEVWELRGDGKYIVNIKIEETWVKILVTKEEFVEKLNKSLEVGFMNTVFALVMMLKTDEKSKTTGDEEQEQIDQKKQLCRLWHLFLSLNRFS